MLRINALLRRSQLGCILVIEQWDVDNMWNMCAQPPAMIQQEAVGGNLCILNGPACDFDLTLPVLL